MQPHGRKLRRPPPYKRLDMDEQIDALTEDGGIRANQILISPINHTYKITAHYQWRTARRMSAYRWKKPYIRMFEIQVSKDVLS